MSLETLRAYGSVTRPWCSNLKLWNFCLWSVISDGESSAVSGVMRPEPSAAAAVIGLKVEPAG